MILYCSTFFFKHFLVSFVCYAYPDATCLHIYVHYTFQRIRYLYNQDINNCVCQSWLFYYKTWSKWPALWYYGMCLITSVFKRGYRSGLATCYSQEQFLEMLSDLLNNNIIYKFFILCQHRLAYYRVHTKCAMSNSLK